MEFARVLKRKPDLSRKVLKSIYKSTGCVFKRKTFLSDKIRAGWRAQHWRSPRLEESLQPDRVKLVLPMVKA